MTYPVPERKRGKAMDIFGVLNLIGGLALFLFGMSAMGDGLVMLSGGRLEQILEKLTKKKIMAVLLGLLVTAVIQSSSATTVMVVGFVNSGIMNLTQAVGIIMGANIGTTVTSWLLSLVGIEGSNIFLKLLKPSSFSPVLAAIGVILTMTAGKSDKRKNIGNILVGFAILMFGMNTMSDAVSPLSKNEAFTSILTAFSNPILGMAAGALLTAVIQSSSASVGILQALCVTGAVSFGTAIPIIMGQNIGTCVTALLSSIGASKNARRASLIHLYFNLVGTLLFTVVFYTWNLFFPFAFLDMAAGAADIAIIHSLFNIGCTIVLFPFSDLLVKLAQLSIPDGKAEETKGLPAALQALDERFLDRPSFAMGLCKDAVIQMADLARNSFQQAMEVLDSYTEKGMEAVISMEQEADSYEDVLGTYLVKLSARDLNKQDSRTLSILLHCINDFERISDHAINVVESAKELSDKNLTLSPESRKELNVYGKAVSDILDLTVSVFAADDTQRARGVEPLEEVIDKLSIEMRQRHIERLRKGACSLEAGLILEDILTGYERVSDHCSNVAVCLIEVHADEFETHEYLNLTTKGTDPWFREEYTKLKKTYLLP